MFNNKVFIWNAILFVAISLTGLFIDWIVVLIALLVICLGNLFVGLIIVWSDKKTGATMLLIGGVLAVIGFSLCSGLIK